VALAKKNRESNFAGVVMPASFCYVKNMKQPTVAHLVKDFLTEADIEQFLAAARKGAHGVRDYLLALMAYRHGFRVSELIDVHLEEVDLKSARLNVRRLKGSLSTERPIEGDELRAIRAWLRVREQIKFARSPYLFIGERGQMTRQAVNYLSEQIGKRAGLAFKIWPHMLRHSCGYYLANKGCNTRLIQDYLRYQNIHHIVRYTRTAAKRFEGLWTK
jgi:type 1 fimbriae regulatory protein FimB